MFPPPHKLLLCTFLLAVTKENTLLLVNLNGGVQTFALDYCAYGSIKADDSRPSASLCFTLTLSCFPEEGDYRFQIEVVSHSVLTCPETFPRVPPYLT